jgi:hypothetical protein
LISVFLALEVFYEIIKLGEPDGPLLARQE